MTPSPSELGLSEDSFCEGKKDYITLTMVRTGHVMSHGSVHGDPHSGRKRGQVHGSAEARTWVQMGCQLARC